MDTDTVCNTGRPRPDVLITRIPRDKRVLELALRRGDKAKLAGNDSVDAAFETLMVSCSRFARHNRIKQRAEESLKDHCRGDLFHRRYGDFVVAVHSMIGSSASINMAMATVHTIIVIERNRMATLGSQRVRYNGRSVEFLEEVMLMLRWTRRFAPHKFNEG